ncbi:hypothetical protein G6F56_003792 [Rhizopus delemar]|nr:hypothetical protein G6F56_003792 [Rhizopus delemar]
MVEHRTVDAVQNAANEAIIYQAEMQVEAINEARKRRKVNREIETESKADKEVDESDSISVIGFNVFGASHWLSLNSIVDIHDDKYMALLNLSDKAVEDLKARFKTSSLIIPKVNDILIKAYKKAEDMPYMQRYAYFTTNQFNHLGDNRIKMSIMATIYKVLSHENSILAKWKSASEWTLIVKIWSNIFESLFEDTAIDLVWGDTKNELLKVDLRLCLNYGGKLYDLSNIEFKKNGNEQKLVKADSAKVLIEGKTIMNKLFEIYNVDFQEATKMKIVVGQACGLKLVFSELRLNAPGCYMPAQYGRTIKYPYNNQSAKTFGEKSLEQLFCYKEMILEEARSLKSNLQKDDSNFGSQSTIQEQTFVKRSYIIPDKAIKWPIVNDDFFKS